MNGSNRESQSTFERLMQGFLTMVLEAHNIVAFLLRDRIEEAVN